MPLAGRYRSAPSAAHGISCKLDLPLISFFLVYLVACFTFAGVEAEFFSLVQQSAGCVLFDVGELSRDRAVYFTFFVELYSNRWES